MTHFLDGPAKGRVLELQRAPVMLRVVMEVVKGSPHFDALDQLDDTPEPSEFIYLYKLASNDGVMHVDGRDPKTGKRYGRTVRMNSYRLYPDPPADEILRDTQRWREWCERLQRESAT